MDNLDRALVGFVSHVVWWLRTMFVLAILAMILAAVLTGCGAAGAAEDIIKLKCKGTWEGTDPMFGQRKPVSYDEPVLVTFDLAKKTVVVDVSANIGDTAKDMHAITYVDGERIDFGESVKKRYGTLTGHGVFDRNNGALTYTSTFTYPKGVEGVIAGDYKRTEKLSCGGTLKEFPRVLNFQVPAVPEAQDLKDWTWRTK